MREFECDIKANSKEWLIEEYINKSRSMEDLARECGVCADTIRTRLNRFGIKIRPPKESSKLKYAVGIKHAKTQKVINRILSQKTGGIIFCLNCGKEVYKSKKKLNTAKFCSISCRDEFYRRNIDRNQDWRDYPEYDEWRKSVYKRDGWKCKICGSKVKINAHHIVPGAKFEEERFSLENGITLCEKHHIQLHTHPSSFIQECIKKTSNIGETPEVDNPETSIKEFLYSLIRSNDYQEESRTDYGIVWSANITNEIAEVGRNDLPR